MIPAKSTVLTNNGNNALNGKNKYEKIAAQLLLEIQTLQTKLHNKRNIINNLTKYRNGLRKATTTYKSTVHQFDNNVKKINSGKIVGTPRVQNMNKTLKKLENEKIERGKQSSHLKNFVKNSGVTVEQSTSKTQKKVEVN
jgi:predicted  nucleic acid-binding Zn-ribbon protein